MNTVDHDTTYDDRMIEVRFHPEAWINDNAVEVDAEGPVKFLVPYEDCFDQDGNHMKNNSYESDDLRFHDNSPKWMKNWDGPFWIEILWPKGLGPED